MLAFHAVCNAAVPVKLIDTNTPGPNGSSITGFDAPTWYSVAATFSNGGAATLQQFGAGSYTIVASNLTPIPGGTGSFVGFNSPDVFLGHATGVNQEGIYTLNNSANIRKVADLNTPVPGGTGNFTRFGAHPAGGQPGSFYAQGSSTQRGIYGHNSVNVSTVFARVDTNTMFPGSTELFTEFSDPVPSKSIADMATFVGRSATRRGVFQAGGNSPGATMLLDTTMPVPSGSAGETFIQFDEAAFAAVPIVIARGATHTGVYWMGQYLGQFVAPSRRIADNTTPIPGGTGVFTGFSDLNAYPAVLDVNPFPTMVFIGYGADGQKGIYGSELYPITGQSLGKVISVGDILDGKLVTDLAMTNQSLTFMKLKFLATFADGSSGIYAVQVPEPSCLCSLALMVVAAARHRRTRYHSVK